MPLQVRSINDLAYRVQGTHEELDTVRSWLKEIVGNRYYLSASHMVSGGHGQHMFWVDFYVREASALFKLTWH